MNRWLRRKGEAVRTIKVAQKGNQDFAVVVTVLVSVSSVILYRGYRPDSNTFFTYEKYITISAN